VRDLDGFTHISESLRDTLKEIIRRVELRPRLQAELGCALTDEEFVEIAKSNGVEI
jgi:hypothetical protein